MDSVAFISFLSTCQLALFSWVEIAMWTLTNVSVHRAIMGPHALTLPARQISRLITIPLSVFRHTAMCVCVAQGMQQVGATTNSLESTPSFAALSHQQIVMWMWTNVSVVLVQTVGSVLNPPATLVYPLIPTDASAMRDIPTDTARTDTYLTITHSALSTKVRATVPCLAIVTSMSTSVSVARAKTVLLAEIQTLGPCRPIRTGARVPLGTRMAYASIHS
jgi:hypothetical protein